MRKVMFVMIIAVLAIGAVSAQGGARGQQWPQLTTIEGTLQLQNGQIAVAAEDGTVLVPSLRRYVGFIEEVKEGARVSVTGFAWGNTLRPTQLIVSGKTYELAPNVPSRMSNPGFNALGNNRGNNRGYNRGNNRGGNCCWDGRRGQGRGCW